MRPQQMPGPPPTREAPPRDALVGPFELTLAAGPGAPVAARAAVRAWMAGRIGETMLADALLLVLMASETFNQKNVRMSVDVRIGMTPWPLRPPER